MASHGHTIDIFSETRRFERTCPSALIAAVIGVAALAAGFVMKPGGADLRQFMNSYLLAYLFVLSISLGCLFFVLIQHVVAAGWSVVVRRLAEQIAGAMPLMALLVIPIVVFRTELYPWLNPTDEMKHLVEHKRPYLNDTFFIIRVAAYFAVWTLLSRGFLSASLRQDANGDAAISTRLRTLAAPSLILYGVTVSFAAVDFMKALSPMWFSTIFGVYWFAGCALSGFGFLALVAMWVQGSGKLTRAITKEHYHDLGKLMFAFVVFWTYIAFSQYMLIWYANIPEETRWYLVRQSGDWWQVSLALLLGHFCIPFVLFISRHPKRSKATLFIFAVWVLLMHWLDLFYLTRPPEAPEGLLAGTGGGIPLHLLDALCIVGVGGLFWAWVASALARHSLVPERDPWLKESLAFENY
ncbi:MAG: quinol:cytochrome C oxidoreductase [Planctomycetia bacterium]|nr:MAG: quinol:cytochrome C oxidoreductase [Planctomycetia bacterium]